MNNPFSNLEIWFVTGSQNLYGPQTLSQVASNVGVVVKSLNADQRIPVKIVDKGVMKTPAEIRAVCLEANASKACIGLVLWMHTFSPSKMWIGGLKSLNKPILHLHTQFNKQLPWDSIDMDFMNLNQSAHGDREAGYLHTRLRLNRKVVVGHWSETPVQEDIAIWSRAAAGWADLQGAEFARIGDNMRYVAVTDGDKVTAEARFGYAVNGYGIGDVVKFVAGISDAAVETLCEEYQATYAAEPDLRAVALGTNPCGKPQHRTGSPGVSSVWSVQRVYHHIRRPPRIKAIARTGGATLNERRLRFWSRGRLENLRPPSGNESDGLGPQRRHVFYGGLHLSPRSSQPIGPWLAYAGNLRVHRRK